LANRSAPGLSTLICTALTIGCARQIRAISSASRSMRLKLEFSTIAIISFVVHRIFETVCPAGLFKVGVKNDVYNDVLFLCALPVVDADDTLQAQVGDSDFVEFI
jgi:hypothetical protein